MAEPPWQETLRLRLAERNAKESAFASIIEQCKSWDRTISRLADYIQTKLN
jgi:autophagy-related protein 16